MARWAGLRPCWPPSGQKGLHPRHHRYRPLVHPLDGREAAAGQARERPGPRLPVVGERL